MPRPLWSGSLSFGLVNVPVVLFSAVRDLDVRFNQIHAPDGARIETRRFCVEEDKEIPFEAIGRAYDVEDGKTVVVTDEELEAVAPRRTRTIDIEAFADLADIDPIYFDHPYLLAPIGDSDGTRRAYQLLVEAMGREDRVAIGRFVMRTKEYLVAIQVRDGRLALTTMRFGDEVRPTGGIDTGAKKKPAQAQLDQAVALIEALSTEWDPSDWEDRYRARLEDVIERKRKGKTIKAPRQVEEEPSPVPDLMAALERSLAEAGRGGKTPAASPARGKRSSSSTGRGAKGGAEAPDGELAELSREELYERAQQAEVPGRSSMTKDELIDALGG